MKRINVISTIAVLLFLNHGFAHAQDAGKSFQINGKLSGATDSVLFYYQDAAGKYAHETKPVINSEFKLNGYISQPESVRVMFKKTGEVIDRYQEEGRLKEFYIEPGMMTITGNPAELKTLKLSGSKTETEFEELETKIQPIREEMKPLEEAFMKEKDHEKAAAIHDRFDPYNNRIKKITYQFFLNHPNSYVTLDMMRFYIGSLSLDSVKQVYNSFNDELKATAVAKELKSQIKNIEAGMPGSIAPAFSKTDINGKPLTLADFKGKYVMLDFWASWCVPCRKSNPHMIALYTKYKSKGFDVIGIADDDGRLKVWNDAVTKDGVGIWHNVLRGLDREKIMSHVFNPDDLDQEYGIAEIPTKILIGPDGKILGRFGDSYGGTEEDMDKMLASIFDK